MDKKSKGETVSKGSEKNIILSKEEQDLLYSTLGLTRKKIANELCGGLSEQSIGQWRHRKYIPKKYFKVIAEAILKLIREKGQKHELLPHEASTIQILHKGFQQMSMEYFESIGIDTSGTVLVPNLPLDKIQSDTASVNAMNEIKNLDLNILVDEIEKRGWKVTLKRKKDVGFNPSK